MKMSVLLYVISEKVCSNSQKMSVLIMIWNLEKFVVLFASLDSSHLESFLKHILEMRVNRKSDFRQDWSIVISGGNWLFKRGCVFPGETLYPLRIMIPSSSVNVERLKDRNVQLCRMCFVINKFLFFFF